MNDNKSFSVNLYSTQKNDDYLEKENVERVLLTDKNSENFYEVKLENIVENNEIVSPKHAIRGSKTFREICYKEYEEKFNISFKMRENIG